MFPSVMYFNWNLKDIINQTTLIFQNGKNNQIAITYFFLNNDLDSR